MSIVGLGGFSSSQQHVDQLYLALEGEGAQSVGSGIWTFGYENNSQVRTSASPRQCRRSGAQGAQRELEVIMYALYMPDMMQPLALHNLSIRLSALL